jgi:hypothetical protein
LSKSVNGAFQSFGNPVVSVSKIKNMEKSALGAYLKTTTNTAQIKPM